MERHEHPDPVFIGKGFNHRHKISHKTSFISPHNEIKKNKNTSQQHFNRYEK